MDNEIRTVQLGADGSLGVTMLVSIISINPSVGLYVTKAQEILKSYELELTWYTFEHKHTKKVNPSRYHFWCIQA